MVATNKPRLMLDFGTVELSRGLDPWFPMSKPVTASLTTNAEKVNVRHTPNWTRTLSLFPEVTKEWQMPKGKSIRMNEYNHV